MINIAFDMETADPDDVFTLCLLAHHPKVNLVCVTVTPGSTKQIGLVKHILALLNKNIPVGAKNILHSKDCVSTFHYNWLGKIGDGIPDGTGAEVLEAAIKQFPDLTIVCGASLGNIGALLDRDVTIECMVIQGGFAGDNIMPPELVLEKFRGKITCPTFNLNGDVPSALKVLDSTRVVQRFYVAKNVCHGVVYEATMHEYIRPHKDNNAGLKLLFEGMDKYLEKKPTGKAFHDPLAACIAINPDICHFERVELYRERGEWGSRFTDKLNAWISIKIDFDKFQNTIVGN